MNRLLGVIGGLGPFASAWFYKRLTELQKVTREQEYIEVLIYSKPSIPDRTGFILKQQTESPFDAMLSAAKVLENSGVSYIAIPCVTAHFFYSELQCKIQTPIINLIEEVSEAAVKTGARRAGLLATGGTVSAGLFQKALAKRDIETVTLSANGQESLMNFIYKTAKTGGTPDATLLKELSDNLLAERADTVILGCTELSLAGLNWHGGVYIDALEILAHTVLEKMTGNANQPAGIHRGNS
jgi:aspartate racemase